MKFLGHTLKNDIKINKIYSVHYFEFAKDYEFPGEKHDFWEMVYADKGEVTVVADDTHTVLSQGNVIFHKPNEWHTIYLNGKSSANVAIVTFESKSEIMGFFENKILTVGQEQKNLISKIISEYTNAFSTPLNKVYIDKPHLKEEPLIGSQQLISQYLCELLILFLRSDSPHVQYTTHNINHSNSMLNILQNYMLDNISSNITIDDLVKYSGTNRMAVNRLFKNNFNTSPINYFINLKIDLAKKYLREDNYNISQIAELLGYSGIHYFSLQFKKVTGMSPTQYAASIKAILSLEIKERTTKDDADIQKRIVK